MGAQIFEAMPFEFYSENDGEFGEYQESTPAFSTFEWEEEFRGRSPSRRAGFSSHMPRGRGPRFKKPLPPSRGGPKKPRHRVPCPPGRRPCPPRGIVGGPYGVVSEPYPLEPTFPTEPGPSGSEYVRWVQDCLNQAMRLQLPVTGFMGVETRSAVRSFQRQQGLRVSGIAGPDTEAALKAACGSQGDRLPPDETEFDAVFESERPRGLLRARPEMELPPAFQANYDRLVSRMKRVRQRNWMSERCYSLSQFNNAPERGGVYLLVFDKPMRDGRIGYVGRTGNLRERLQGHHRDALQFGLDPTNYAFCYIETPQYLAVEEAIRRDLNPTGLVTNQLELEMEQEF